MSDQMPAAVATDLLLGRRTTNRLRKVCRAARSKIMQSDTPIRKDKDGEYYAEPAKLSTRAERLAQKLTGKTLAQITKWLRRAAKRSARCRILSDALPESRTKSQLDMRAVQHDNLANACRQEMTRRGV